MTNHTESESTASPDTVDTSATAPPVSNLCVQLDRRLEHLNQLDRRVTNITRRLSERMRSLNSRMSNEHRRLRTSSALSRSTGQRGDGSGARLHQLAQFRVNAASRLRRIMSAMDASNPSSSVDFEGSSDIPSTNPGQDIPVSSVLAANRNPTDDDSASDPFDNSLANFARRRRRVIDEINSSGSLLNGTDSNPFRTNTTRHSQIASHISSLRRLSDIAHINDESELTRLRNSHNNIPLLRQQWLERADRHRSPFGVDDAADGTR